MNSIFLKEICDGLNVHHYVKILDVVDVFVVKLIYQEIE